jgi:pSer/pThr/pTyr-binding forkhead associated (FHA) protein
MMYQLRVMLMSGPDDGTEIILHSDNKGHRSDHGWEFVIGRREDCDIPLLYDTQASREHAGLIVQKDGVVLVDKNSRNGVHLNNKRISSEVKLNERVIFKIGHTWIRLQEWSVT